MPISFGGINTGLPPNLVEQIIAAERLPIQNLEKRNSNMEAKKALVEELETKLRGLRTSLDGLAGTGGFRDIKLHSSDPAVITGVVDPLAAPSKGNYSVEVIQLAQKASALTNGFPDRDTTEVGVGYIEFETDEGTKEVYIDGENNTLDGVVRAINNAGVGLRAAIVTDRSDEDYPFKLVLSGEGVGTDNRIEYPTVYFLDGDQDFYFDEEKPAQNGKVKIDGFEFEIAENQLNDLIPGVSLQLRNAKPGSTINLDVSEDMEVVSGKIDEFVKAANGLLGFIQTQSKVDANTDTSRNLGGDSLLRSVANRIRRVFQGSQVGTGDIKRLNQIGLEYNRSGTLDFNKERFSSTLQKSPEAVERFFAGDGFVTGLIPTVRNMVRTLVEPGRGIVTNRKRGFDQRIEQTNKQIDRKEDQLARKEQTLRRKFANLEETMSRLKSQGGQLAALGGGGVGGINLGG